jgi:hypothetical protein
MKKVLIIVLLVFFSARSEHRWFLDAGTKGIGVGNEIKYKSLLFHFGGHALIEYEHNDSCFDGAVITDDKTDLQLIPYLGIGINVPLWNNVTMKAFVDYMQIHHLGCESLTSTKNEGTGLGFYVDRQYELFRIILGGIYCKWKTPIGLLFDTDFIHKDTGGFNINVSPRLIVYL